MSAPRVLITGGSGLIGRALTTALLGDGCRVAILTRRPDRFSPTPGENVELFARLRDIPEQDPVSAVVNLAGARIVGARWTTARKQVLRESRIDLTRSLVEWMGRRESPPATLISGSAVGYYGDTGDLAISEEAGAGDDFGAQLCRDWEAAAEPATAAGIRVACIRTGLVLAKNGGMLPPMRLSFSLGLGAKLGDGRQWMSWIHIDDHVAAIRHLLSSEDSAGAYNLTAPTPVSNRDFSDILAETLHRPRLLTAPAFALRALLGESAALLMGGQRALPVRLEREGFAFRHRDLSEALCHLLGVR